MTWSTIALDEPTGPAAIAAAIPFFRQSGALLSDKRESCPLCGLRVDGHSDARSMAEGCE